MKKTISFVAFSLVVVFTASAQIPQYEYVPEIDKGKVRTLSRVSHLRYVRDGKEVNTIDQRIFHFDRKGRVIEIHNKSSFDGITGNVSGMEYLTTYTYNNNGAIASEVSINKAQERPFRVISYTYDKQGRRCKGYSKTFTLLMLHICCTRQHIMKQAVKMRSYAWHLMIMVLLQKRRSGNTGMMIRAGR